MVYRCTRCDSGLIYDKKAGLLYCKFCGSYYSAEICTEQDLEEMSEMEPTREVDQFVGVRPSFDSMSMDFPDLEEGNAQILNSQKSTSPVPQRYNKPVNLFAEPDNILVNAGGERSFANTREKVETGFFGQTSSRSLDFDEKQEARQEGLPKIVPSQNTVEERKVEEKKPSIEISADNFYDTTPKKATPSPSLASIESAFASAAQAGTDEKSLSSKTRMYSSMNFDDDLDENGKKKLDTVNIFSKSNYANANAGNHMNASTPVEENRSVFSTPVEETRSVFSTPVEETRSVFSTPVEETKSVFSTPVEENRSVFSTPVEETRSVFSTPAEETRSVFSTPVEETRSVFSTPPVEETQPMFSEPVVEETPAAPVFENHVPTFNVPQFQVTQPAYQEPVAQSVAEPVVQEVTEEIPVVEEQPVKSAPRPDYRRIPTVNKEPEVPEPDDMDMRIYYCTSCNAKVMVMEGEVSPFCSFCGNSSIIFDRALKLDRPKRILPFRLTKENAQNVIKDRLGYGKFSLDEVSDLEVESVSGIYIPYWVYQTEIERSMDLAVTEDVPVEGPTAKKGQTQQKTTEYSKKASNNYYVYLDACKSLNDVMAERLEPYHMDKMVRFSTSYLKGYYADKYDVVAAERLEDAHICSQMLLDNDILSQCSGVKRDEKDPDRVLNVEKKNITEKYEVLNTEYVMLPAYFVAIRYMNHSYNVIVNGQTGKVVSNLPLNQQKVKKEIVKNSILTGLLFSMFFMLFTSISFGATSLTFLLALPLAALGYFVFIGLKSKKKFDESYYRMQLSKLQKYAEEGGR